MRHISSAKERFGLLVCLTDHAVIAAEVGSLQAKGYTELAVWRYFLEGFIVDLDALSLIITQLYGALPSDREPRPTVPKRTIGYREAA